MTNVRFDRGNLTLQELADRTGKSRRQISRWTSKPRTLWLAEVHERHDTIRNLKAEGLKPREIADTVGCGLSTVYNVLAKTA